MTINYPDGTVLEAVLLSRESETLRAAVPGDDDVRTFKLIRGAWISEKCEPVKIEFAWQRCEETRVPTETECVCSKELAARLSSLVLVGTEADDLIENMLYVYSARGHHIRIQQGRLIISDGPAEVDLEFSSASGLPN